MVSYTILYNIIFYYIMAPLIVCLSGTDQAGPGRRRQLVRAAARALGDLFLSLVFLVMMILILIVMMMIIIIIIIVRMIVVIVIFLLILIISIINIRRGLRPVRAAPAAPRPSPMEQEPPTATPNI